MKIIFILLALFSLASSANAAEEESNALLGVWISEPSGAFRTMGQIEITKTYVKWGKCKSSEYEIVPNYINLEPQGARLVTIHLKTSTNHECSGEGQYIQFSFFLDQNKIRKNFAHLEFYDSYEQRVKGYYSSCPYSNVKIEKSH